ncbi:MAG TPA: BON domain-containing protein [Bryobacteraceae bacterium]|nr:BON domain-containing protein [Bryobacteraceae bacterium]
MRVLATFTMLCVMLLSSGALTAQASKADDRIYDQVRLKLASHPDVKGGAIEVEVVDGVVTLSGKVRTERARTKAESVAHKVKGVKKVVNNLQVNPT